MKPDAAPCLPERTMDPIPKSIAATAAGSDHSWTGQTPADLLSRRALLLGGAALFPRPAVAKATSLRIYMGAGNRPDLMRKLLDLYEQRNPGLRLVIETGGATSEQQRQYLSTVLSARDASLDVMQIDIVNPAQFMKARWIEPLEPYLGADAASLLKAYLPAYARANQVEGRVATLPAYVDAQFLYHRKDLLDKHGQAVPNSWTDLVRVARRVLDREGSATLKGLSIQGAPIDGAVCTFLTPYWSQGKALVDEAGMLTLDREAAERGMALWLSMMDQGVVQHNAAEVKTQDTTQDFRGGQALFAVSWGFAWSRFQEADSPVRGKVGVAPLPAMPGGRNVTCAGGWQWAVSAFSAKKAAAAQLVRWLASSEVARYLAIHGAMLPAWPELYADPGVLKAMPWIASALPVLESARARPVTPRYGEFSDAVRTSTSAMLGRSLSVPAGVAQIESRLRRIFR